MEKPLYEKLGVKRNGNNLVIGFQQDYYQLIGVDYPINSISKLKINNLKDGFYDFIHVFTNKIEFLEESMLVLKGKIVQNGMLWYSWFKKSSGLPSEISEDLIRNTALNLNLVDVKVCSVDRDWSALKLVIPRKYRNLSE